MPLNLLTWYVPADNKENTTPGKAPAESTPDGGRGKNKFFLARWFGFGSE